MDAPALHSMTKSFPAFPAVKSGAAYCTDPDPAVRRHVHPSPQNLWNSSRSAELPRCLFLPLFPMSIEKENDYLSFYLHLKIFLYDLSGHGAEFEVGSRFPVC